MSITSTKEISNKKKWSHSLVWFRNDLRIIDNPALFSACQRSDKVTAVFLIAEKQWREHDWSNRRIYLTLLALRDLANSLAKLGIPLQIESINHFKKAPKAVEKIVQEKSIDAIYFNAEYALDEKNRDSTIQEFCTNQEIHLNISHGSLIIPPGTIRTKTRTPYKIFTPFKREWINTLVSFDRMPLGKPKAVTSHFKKNDDENSQLLSQRLHKYKSKITKQDLYFNENHGTEIFAQKQLRQFIASKVNEYDDQRDVPSIDGTSSLSPALTVGLISPRSCLHAARAINEGHLADYKKGVDTWINEIIWREFYCHLLADFPQISLNKPLKPATDYVPWRHNESEFTRWCEGKTGYPLVDAAMRQLNETGWMHNRLRMVTATFLTKYLLIDWRMGEKYFMQQLYDGHFASNNGGWQWSASTGTDAAPYFRILSPVRQAERFDKDGLFIKRYIPELQDLSPKIIHQPGHSDMLATGYPAPMVDLKEGKERCLQGFQFALNR